MRRLCKSSDFRGHGGPPLFKQVTEQREQAHATVIGFYSATTQGVFTHPGESWHLHVLFADEGKAGHVDALAVQQGAVLKLRLLSGNYTKDRSYAP